MILTSKERKQFKFLLPAQSDLETIETVAGILEKIKEDDQEEKNIDLTEKEFFLLKKMIKILDHEKQIHLQSLPLIKKILANNEVSL